MRSTTLIGALAGAAVLALGGGLALAGRRRTAPSAEPPYFVYTVQPGDTLSALAKTFFGDAQKWFAIVDFNNDLLKTGPRGGVDTLPVGAKLRVPCTWVSVQLGDTLAKIAQRALGDGGRWRRIWEANKKTVFDPDRLLVGQRLAVPREPVPTPAPGTAVSVGEDLDLLDAEYVGCYP